MLYFHGRMLNLKRKHCIFTIGWSPGHENPYRLERPPARFCVNAVFSRSDAAFEAKMLYFHDRMQPGERKQLFSRAKAAFEAKTLYFHDRMEPGTRKFNTFGLALVHILRKWSRFTGY